MHYFKKILRYAVPYKRYAFLNIFFNILYALFSTLSFLALIPVLQVIFSDQRSVGKIPVYEGLMEITTYLQDSMSYYLVQFINQYGDFKVLLFMIGVIISIFLLKNVSNYLAMYYATFLRNGVLKDLRNALYSKVVSFPLAFYSEKLHFSCFYFCRFQVFLFPKLGNL